MIQNQLTKISSLSIYQDGQIDKKYYLYINSIYNSLKKNQKVNLMKNVKDPYKENCKPLKKDGGRLQNMERSPMFMDWQSQHSKNGYTTKGNLHVQLNTPKHSSDIHHRD
jgi:hypothetical protein